MGAEYWSVGEGQGKRQLSGALGLFRQGVECHTKNYILWIVRSR